MQRKVYSEVSINNFISKTAFNYDEFFAFYLDASWAPHLRTITTNEY